MRYLYELIKQNSRSLRSWIGGLAGKISMLPGESFPCKISMGKSYGSKENKTEKRERFHS